MKNIPVWVLELIAMVGCVTLCILLFKVIWSSDLPMWLKWFLLR